MPGVEKIEAYEKRYGNIAIENGFINSQQLVEALHTQVMEEINDGKHRLIGAILYDLSYISLTQDKEVLDELIKD